MSGERAFRTGRRCASRWCAAATRRISAGSRRTSVSSSARSRASVSTSRSSPRRPTAGCPRLEHDGAVVVRRFRSIVPGQRDAQAPTLWAWIASRRADYDLMHFHSYHALVSAASLVARPPVVFTPHYHGTGHSPARAALHHVYRPVGRQCVRRARRP